MFIVFLFMINISFALCQTNWQQEIDYWKTEFNNKLDINNYWGRYQWWVRCSNGETYEQNNKYMEGSAVMYYAGAGIDSYTSMYIATEDIVYFTYAKALIDNAINNSLPCSQLYLNPCLGGQWPTESYYYGWTGYWWRDQCSPPSYTYEQNRLYEIAFFERVAKLLYLVKHTPALYNSYASWYSSTLSFVEKNLWEKWKSRYDAVGKPLHENNIEMASRWGQLALNLYLLTTDGIKRNEYYNFLNEINEEENCSMRYQEKAIPSNYYSWYNELFDGYCNNYEVNTMDVSHANMVVSYIINSNEQCLYWNDNDITGLKNFRNALWDQSEEKYYDFLNFTYGEVGGWTETGKSHGLGWVKLARYNEIMFNDYKQKYQTGKVDPDATFCANMTLNAKILDQTYCNCNTFNILSPNKFFDEDKFIGSVSGDFDRDGNEGDIAVIYRNYTNNIEILVWKSLGNGYCYKGSWHTSNSFDALKISGKIVAGDFDRDGYKDDIAALYDYGNNHTSIFVWKSTGSSFSWPGTWYSSYSFNAGKTTGKIVSGDFDRDGKHDDIAALYDYGNNLTRIFVWKSTGSSFSSPGTWYTDYSFNAEKTTGKVVSGDFDRDGKHDDIAALYDHGNNHTSIFVWKSTGSSFSWPGTWYSSYSFNAGKTTGKVVSGDFDRDGKHDDIAAFYDYGSNYTRIFVWKSTGSSLGYPGTWYTSYTFDASKIADRLVSGDFDRDGKFDDIAAFYLYSSSSNPKANMFTWKSTGSSFPITTEGGWWANCSKNSNYPTLKSSKISNVVFTDSNEIIGNAKRQHDEFVNIYPIPASDILYLDINIEKINNIEINVFDIIGRNVIKMREKDSSKNRFELNITNLENGVYQIVININKEQVTRKIIISK